jgi:hypothetical protein
MFTDSELKNKDKNNNMLRDENIKLKEKILELENQYNCSKKILKNKYDKINLK